MPLFMFFPDNRVLIEGVVQSLKSLKNNKHMTVNSSCIIEGCKRSVLLKFWNRPCFPLNILKVNTSYLFCQKHLNKSPATVNIPQSTLSFHRNYSICPLERKKKTVYRSVDEWKCFICVYLYFVHVLLL